MTPLLIERREFKYHLDAATAQDVRDAIRPFCDLDAFSAKQPDHRYTIESLYCDTPNLALYTANENEILDRFKLRARWYPQNPDGPVFFEVKRRVHDIIIKSRGPVTEDVHGDWRDLVDDPFVPPERVGGHPAVERFVAMLHSHGAAPKTIVRYEREAWASTIDEYARVTFDSSIRCVKTDHARRGTDADPWRAQDDPETMGATRSLTVLELKFQQQAPSWMTRLVQRLSLWRRSFSKYCTSIDSFAIPRPRRAVMR